MTAIRDNRELPRRPARVLHFPTQRGVISPDPPHVLPVSQARRLASICILVGVFAATSGQIWQDKVSRKNAEGNVLYDQKNYPGALEKYVEANNGKAHQQRLAYNLANTFYQQRKYPEALREL